MLGNQFCPINNPHLTKKMILYKNQIQLRAYINNLRANGTSIGFVPTMGALHQGHISLIKEAKSDTDFVVCSIFVNPTQFNNATDLEKYPRTLENDLQLLLEAGCDMLYWPNAEDVYAHEDPNFKFDFGNVVDVMEGAFRPGHFEGVGRVVKLLLEIVAPNKLFMGLKDYQQCAVVQQLLVLMKNDTIELVKCATLREEDGLAMSSRNARLTPEARQAATCIYKALKNAHLMTGEVSVQKLKEITTDIIDTTTHMRTEYVEIVDGLTLQPIANWSHKNPIQICIAAFAGDIRLIDNVRLR